MVRKIVQSKCTIFLVLTMFTAVMCVWQQVGVPESDRQRLHREDNTSNSLLLIKHITHDNDIVIYSKTKGLFYSEWTANEGKWRLLHTKGIPWILGAFCNKQHWSCEQATSTRQCRLPKLTHTKLCCQSFWMGAIKLIILPELRETECVCVREKERKRKR